MAKGSLKFPEKAFREWLDEQPVGKTFTARDVEQMLLGKGLRCQISLYAVRFLLMRFDNVEAEGKTARNRCGSSVIVYRKVRE